MRTFRARGPQCAVSGRRCEALRRISGVSRPSYSRSESAAVWASSNSVPVTISMKCKVEYGESLRLVGNLPFLGAWDPSKGAQMAWSDGNVWKADAVVPVGAEVDFKVVRAKKDGGEVVWEDGDNRSFKILGPDFGLRVTCHWGRPGEMKVDAYPVQQQQGGAEAGSSNGAIGASSHNGTGAPRERLQVSGQSSRSGSSLASVSMDSGDGSSNNGNGRSGTSTLARSSLEDESSSRTAWVGAEPEFVRSRRKDEQSRGGVWRTEGLSGVALELVGGDEQASSWLKKLGLQKRLLVDESPACRPGLDAMSYLYVYATWVNTGALPCAESGSHYRPNHHANLALAMFRSLEWVIGDVTRGGGARSPSSERLILAARRMHSRLPSFSGQFRASTPLTRIRDIAHRNDIPKDLKDEIKHTLQNKLHRCAGPEDLVATEAMLQRVTAVPGQYSEAFVEQFRIFTEELREFFNASGLVELLTGAGAVDALDDGHASAVRQLISTKQRVEEMGQGARLDDLMALLTAATQARSFYAAGLVAGLRNDVTDEILSMRQRWRLADIRLEEYSFVVLSRIIGLLEEMGAPSKLPRASNLQWALPLAALTSGLRHMGLSLFDTRELLVLENELQRWHATCPLVETREAALRAKASLERALRVATEYSDMVAEVYGGSAAALGRALGLPEHMGAVFAEAEVRASMAFQVSKLAAMLARALRTAAGQEPWDVLVPGEATGVLREAAQLDAEALRGPAPGGEEGVVLVVRRADGDEELGPLGPRLRGVVLLQELPHLSHLGVRARQDRVTFVTCDDEDTVSRVLRPLMGRRVTLSAAGDSTVTVREASGPVASSSSSSPSAAPAQSSAAAASAAAPDGAAAAAVAAAAKAGRWGDVVVPLERAVAATCGSKSAKCAALSSLATASGGLFSAPRGAVLPFGCLEAAVAAAGRGAEYGALLARLDDPRVGGEELEAACGEMRALVEGLEVPAGMVQQAVAAITASSAAPAQSQLQGGPRLLAVRSSANVEDLAGMSAAGLYDSVVGVPADDAAAVAAAVGEVWASLYTRRAVLSRRSAGVPQSSARMAVLLMEAVAPDLSFVLHTARPRDGNRDVLLAEVAAGQGETLASGTRGTPWRFEVAKTGNGAITTLAFANFSTALVLPAKGKPVASFASYGSGAAAAAAAGNGNGAGASDGNGARRSVALVEREVDYGSQRMSADGDWRQATVRQMAAAGSYIEKAMDGVPQDIEGGVVVGPDGGLALHIFQTRPQ
ncbi:2,3-dihydroxyphenylpropionate/2, 3-dihydroxicinnamic acid 1,2-dioxygenase [Pleodorina starrii]|uniref:2,3-dihydroxyphenylpropionate/2, 3-dihydroxicinnamic acid 1,2-dioxygenase n=1 Tax=Pleodorina starrii TaxID=330485 RepID=A0A9W6BEA6_9CHLO|nr:2,3-dihydroxyphenylpropionate/2, 3-dihydroxicinnamic acid 1,2-dioxygenase [Pleodorina starrii]